MSLQEAVEASGDLKDGIVNQKMTIFSLRGSERLC